MASLADQYSWGQGRRNVIWLYKKTSQFLNIFFGSTALVHMWSLSPHPLHLSHTHTLLFRTSCHWGIICPRALPPAGSLTLTKGSTGLPHYVGCQEKRLGIQVTHPNPPAGIWATAASQKALWAPAVCEGISLQLAATSNWHPRSSAAEPGLSGRRWISADDRAPEGEPRLSQHLDSKRVDKGLPTYNPLPLYSPLSLTLADHLRQVGSNMKMWPRASHSF